MGARAWRPLGGRSRDSRPPYNYSCRCNRHWRHTEQSGNHKSEPLTGDDWTDIKHYREFEIAPTGDWVDLAIDLTHDKYEADWNSGWQRLGRIDEANHTWYAAARVPLKSVSEHPVKAGTKWRANLYRIDGLGEDPQRHFMCWQPTCVVNRDPNHVPENFGTLIFTK